MSERSTLLITGGAGFVGSHVARLAHERGRRVVVLDDLSGGEPARLPAGIELVVGDIGDALLVRRLISAAGVSAVAHFAGKIQVGESVRDPATYFEVNLVRTLTMLGALRDEGVRGCLFSSTAAVYGDPTSVPIPETACLAPVNPYGASKLGIEHALAAWEGAYGLAWAALRYFNAAGAHRDGTMREAHQPETHLIPLVLDAGLGRRPPLTVFGRDYDTPDGTCIRDYIHVEDLATAHLAALTEVEAGRTVGAVNLGTGRGYSVAEVLASAATVLGRPVPHEVGPRRPGDPPRLVADPARAAERLGWQPRLDDLDFIVRSSIEWERKLLRNPW
jgi:UDP-glucose-4-epimerase GalE